MSDSDELSAQVSAVPAEVPGGGKPGIRLARNLIFYTIVRLMLVLALALLIIGLGQLADTDIPVLVAAIIAVVIALPLSMLLFARIRTEINTDIAAVDAGRREKREDLRRRMDEV